MVHDKKQVKKLLTDAVTLLCRSSLKFSDEVCVEGLLGITLDKKDILLISIQETIQSTLKSVNLKRNDNVEDNVKGKRARNKRKRKRSRGSIDSSSSSESNDSDAGESESYLFKKPREPSVPVLLSITKIDPKGSNSTGQDQGHMLVNNQDQSHLQTQQAFNNMAESNMNEHFQNVHEQGQYAMHQGDGYYNEEEFDDGEYLDEIKQEPGDEFFENEDEDYNMMMGGEIKMEPIDEDEEAAMIQEMWEAQGGVPYQGEMGQPPIASMPSSAKMGAYPTHNKGVYSTAQGLNDINLPTTSTASVNANNVPLIQKDSGKVACIQCLKEFANQKSLTNHYRKVHLGQNESASPSKSTRSAKQSKSQTQTTPASQMMTQQFSPMHHSTPAKLHTPFQPPMTPPRPIATPAQQHQQAHHQQSQQQPPVPLQAQGQSQGYNCLICNASFKSNTHLNSHYSKQHPDDCNHPCKYCDRHFFSADALNSHKNKKHEDKLLMEQVRGLLKKS